MTILKARLFSSHPLRHGFSTRLGGVSQGDLSGLNLSFACNDDHANVLVNRTLYFAAMGSDSEAAVYCQQVHGRRVCPVSQEDRGRGSGRFDTGIPECDGLLTADAGVPLNIFTADCVAVLFYDPVRHVAAACHAGWPGSALGIVEEVVDTLSALYGSVAHDLLVAMGPSASACCYEVDERVVKSLDSGLSQEYVRPGRPGRYMVDLRLYNSLRLIRSGVVPSNIERVGGCSICGHEFFSHRRQSGKAGRMLATIELLNLSGRINYH